MKKKKKKKNKKQRIFLMDNYLAIQHNNNMTF